MRTTLTLEPDVVELLEEEAHRSGKPWKHVVNEAIRRGLSSRPARTASAPFRVRPHAATVAAGLDSARFNALVEELEVESRLALPAKGGGRAAR